MASSILPQHGAQVVDSIKEEWGTGLIAKQINSIRRASELGRQEEGLTAHSGGPLFSRRRGLHPTAGTFI